MQRILCVTILRDVSAIDIIFVGTIMKHEFLKPRRTFLYNVARCMNKENAAVYRRRWNPQTHSCIVDCKGDRD